MGTRLLVVCESAVTMVTGPIVESMDGFYERVDQGKFDDLDDGVCAMVMSLLQAQYDAEVKDRDMVGLMVASISTGAHFVWLKKLINERMGD